jgi:uncharacterized protein (TIRG00374 family)
MASNATPKAGPVSSQKPNSGRVPNIVKTMVKIAIAAGLIYWLVSAGILDFNTFVQLATPSLVAFCAVCVFMQVFVNNYRWLKLLRGQGFETTVRRTLPLSFIGLFFNFAMPGGVGGDVIKGYYVLQEHPNKKYAAAVSIFMDRVFGLFIMIATAFTALIFNWHIVEKSNELKSVAYGVAALFIAFLVFFFLSFSRVLQHSSLSHFLFVTLPGGRRIKHIYEALHSYRKAPGAIVYAMLLSVVNQVLIVAFTYVIGLRMDGAEIPLSVYFFLVPVGTVVTAIPISPAGIGVGQAAFYFLFSHYLGRESSLGPTSVTAMQIMNFAWGLLGAFFYLQRKAPQVES